MVCFLYFYCVVFESSGHIRNRLIRLAFLVFIWLSDFVKRGVNRMQEFEIQDEIFEEVEEIVTAGWLGCAQCCN